VKAPTTSGLHQMMVQHEVDPSDLPSAIPVVLVQINVNKDLPPATGHRTEFIPAMPKPPIFPAFLTNITKDEANAPRPGIDKHCIPLDPTSSATCGTANNPRLVTFSTDPPALHKIDGKQFEESPEDTKTVALNTVEEWQVENTTTAPGPVAHPFHIHVNPFQLVEIFDPNQNVVNGSGQTIPKYITTKPDPNNAPFQCQIDPQKRSTWVDCHNGLADDKDPRIWWDVFPIPSPRAITDANSKTFLIPGHFRMRSRFVDFPGVYVIHCHILAHEDRGMMALVELKRPDAPSVAGLFSHH
jgi:FtsP/CotA-like multicopper oxidase with cupredoxin domain